VWVYAAHHSHVVVRCRPAQVQFYFSYFV
jgi:hypothetical protein